MTRNALESPGATRVDVRLAREFRLTGKDDGPKATFRADAFNVLNQVNFTRFVGNQRSAFFGQPVAALAGRRLQVSVGVEF